MYMGVWEMGKKKKVLSQEELPDINEFLDKIRRDIPKYEHDDFHMELEEDPMISTNA